MNSGEERLHALDSLRAVAMFLGIVLHASLPFVEAPVLWLVRDVSRSSAFDVMVVWIHGFRMQLFFFIGGFFAHLLWQRLGTRQFLIHRGKRIALPLILGMGVIIPLTLAVVVWAELFRGASLPQPEGIDGYAIPTMHLWFLEMLLVLYLIAMAIVWAWRTVSRPTITARVDAAFRTFFQSRWKPFVLLPPTIVCLWNGPMYGEVDQMGVRLLFAPRVVAYFGLFFAVGWCLHRQRQLLDELRKWLTSYLLLALLAFVTLVACLITLLKSGNGGIGLKLIALTAAALYAWTMTFALTGLFLRVAHGYRPWVRYLADASYWCYLWHIPIVMWLHVMVAKAPINGWLKLTFIVTVTLVVLLATYHLFVRYTRIGEILNGPRTRSTQTKYEGAYVGIQ